MYRLVRGKEFSSIGTIEGQLTELQGYREERVPSTGYSTRKYGETPSWESSWAARVGWGRGSAQELTQPQSLFLWPRSTACVLWDLSYPTRD